VVGLRPGPDGGVGDSSWWRQLAWTGSSVGRGLLAAPAPAWCMRQRWAPVGSCSASGVATAAASVKTGAWPGGPRAALVGLGGPGLPGPSPLSIVASWCCEKRALVRVAA
jgi:hypothetical protein